MSHDVQQPHIDVQVPHFDWPQLPDHWDWVSCIVPAPMYQQQQCRQGQAEAAVISTPTQLLLVRARTGKGRGMSNQPRPACARANTQPWCGRNARWAASAPLPPCRDGAKHKVVY